MASQKNQETLRYTLLIQNFIHKDKCIQTYNIVFTKYLIQGHLIDFNFKCGIISNQDKENLIYDRLQMG
jgi:site-specific recombinase